MKNSLRIDYAKIKSFRIARKLTQTELADLLNIHPSTYSKFENGHDKHIDIAKLKGCANLFEVSFYELLIDESDKKRDTFLEKRRNEIENEIREIRSRIDHLSQLLHHL